MSSVLTLDQARLCAVPLLLLNFNIFASYISTILPLTENSISRVFILFPKKKHIEKENNVSVGFLILVRNQTKFPLFQFLNQLIVNNNLEVNKRR